MGGEVTLLNVNDKGMLDLNELEAAITPKDHTYSR
jgi:cysteine sulfinate desulfinase/cysteine desulfurase-like protein